MVKMKSVLYARVSTKEQAEEGYSLSAQTTLLKGYADRKDLDIVKQFIIPESASGKQERKTFIEMLEYLEFHKEVKFILCEKVDRLTRNFKDAVKLDDWLNEDEERQIHFVKQSLIIHKNAKSNEKFQWDIWLVLARQYSNNLSEEARKGLSQKAEEGWYPGPHKKGYKSIGNTGRKTWVIDNSPGSEALFIKKAFEFYNTNNYSLKRLCQVLFEEEGWKRRDGEKIGKSELHKILSDCFYCGEFNWNGKHYPVANHQPLIPKELFYSVQEKLRRKLTGKYHKHFFLFGDGLIQCGECGRSIVATTAKGHNYYYCTRFERNCSQRKYAREETLEKQILDFFGSLEIKNEKLLNWIKKALKESHSDEMEYHNKVLQELNKQYAQIQKRIDALYDDKIDDNISKEFYQRKFEQYRCEQNAVLNRIHHHKEANVNYFELGINILELSQKTKDIYLSRSAEEKRQLLSFVFSNLSLKDGNLSPVYAPAFQIVAKRAENQDWLGRMDSNHHNGIQNPGSYR